jgi:hypothetical protein
MVDRVREGGQIGDDMLSLDGQQKKRLRESLISAFPGAPELQRMVSDYLDLNLATVAPPAGDLETQAFELIQWAEAHGKLGDLVLAGRYSNPDNPDLYAFAFRLGLTSSDHDQGTLEAIVGPNTTFLDPHTWRAQLTKLEWKVCRIDIDQKGAGTGFLVGPDAVLTNHHVMERAINEQTEPERFTCLFDFKMTDNEVVSQGTRFDLAQGGDWLIDSAPHSAVDLVPDPKPGDPGPDELDLALIRLAEPAGSLGVAGAEEGATREWVTLGGDQLDLTQLHAISILQHPNQLPLKLALGMEQNLEVNLAGNRVRYSVPTLPGSSGSPVFDSDWRLIALHHSGDPDTIKPEFNEGIPIWLIAQRPAVASYVDSFRDGV